jgi:large conductance mechanosensitive channel
MKGFKQFLLRGNVLDLAVGVVIGVAFGAVITSFVKNLLTPLIAALVGKPDFSAYSFEINGSKLLYGEFVNTVISFLLVATAVYFFLVLPLNKLVERSRKSAVPADPTTKKCPECLSEIPIEARRCAHCTTAIVMGA